MSDPVVSTISVGSGPRVRSVSVTTAPGANTSPAATLPYQPNASIGIGAARVVVGEAAIGITVGVTPGVATTNGAVQLGVSGRTPRVAELYDVVLDDTPLTTGDRLVFDEADAKWHANTVLDGGTF